MTTVITPIIGIAFTLLSFLSGICVLYLAFTYPEFVSDKDRRYGAIACGILFFLLGVFGICFVGGWIP